MSLTGGFTVDRYFAVIDVLCFLWTVMYVALSVTKSYVTSVAALFITFYFQGALETVLHTGEKIDMCYCSKHLKSKKLNIVHRCGCKCLWVSNCKIKVRPKHYTSWERFLIFEEYCTGISIVWDGTVSWYFFCSFKAGYRILHKTWREKATVPFHTLNVGYGVGSIIIPFIVKPYLDPRFSGNSQSVNGINHCNEGVFSTTASTTQNLKLKYPADFVTAYWILAPFGVLVAFGFIGHLIYAWKQKIILIRPARQPVDGDATGSSTEKVITRLKRSIELHNCSPKRPTVGLLIIIMVAFYTAACTPIARVFSKFIFSYARDGACMTLKESITLQSAYFVAVTGGKLFGCIFSAFLSVGIMMQVRFWFTEVTLKIKTFLSTGVVTCALSTF